MLKDLPKPRKSSAANQERIAFRAECESQSIRLFDPDEIQQRLREIFGDKDQCVYCGDEDIKKLTWDHLVPITPPKPDEGDEIGHSVTGNLVTACSSCNSSKGNNNFKEWMSSDSPKSPKIVKCLEFANDRIAKLKCYQKLKKENKSLKASLSKLHNHKSEIDKKRKKISKLRRDLKKELECLDDFTKKILTRLYC